MIAAPSRSAANVNATKSSDMPPSLIRIQRLFLIAEYLIHMTARASRSAIRGKRSDEVAPSLAAFSPSSRVLSKVQSVDQRMRLGMSAFANCGRAVAHLRGSYVPMGDIDLPNAIVATDSARCPCRDGCERRRKFSR